MNQKKIIISKFRRAETLVEVVMAIFIVAVGSAAATTLIVSALQANSFSRDNLIALNLAVEGLEAMRNVRDTNWLKFNFDKEHCWNMQPGAVVVDNVCKPEKLIAAGQYTVDLNPLNMEWTLSNAGTGQILDLNSLPNSSDYLLQYVDFQSTLPGTHGLYVSKNAITAAGDKLTSAGDSKFYRMITIAYDPASDVPAVAQTMTVTSLVQWKDGPTVHQVSLNTILTNYQKTKS